MYRVVEHSERSFAFSIDWLSQRVLGEFRTGGYICEIALYSLLLLARCHKVNFPEKKSKFKLRTADKNSRLGET